jgi:hypothetical protein
VARPIPQADLEAIEAAVRQHEGGASDGQIAEALVNPGARRTLQYRLGALVDAGRLRLTGDGRAELECIFESEIITDWDAA